MTVLYAVVDKGADADLLIGTGEVQGLDFEVCTFAREVYGNVDVAAFAGEDDVGELQGFTCGNLVRFFAALRMTEGVYVLAVSHALKLVKAF